MRTIDITTSVFRQNQKKYFDLAREGENVLVHSGTDIFRIELVKPKNWEPDEETWRDIEQAEKEYREGKTYRMLEGESLSEFLTRTCTR